MRVFLRKLNTKRPVDALLPSQHYSIFQSIIIYWKNTNECNSTESEVIPEKPAEKQKEPSSTLNIKN